jgi:hypothetical protein
MAIPSETWLKKDREITKLKKKYSLEDVEIHTGWMLRRYLEQEHIANFEKLNSEDRIKGVLKERQKFLAVWAVNKSSKQLKEKKKNFKETLPYIHLTLEERRKFLSELADIIGSWSDCRLFGEVIKKSNFDITKSSTGDLYETAFHQVVTRFETFLTIKSKVEKNIHLGLLISDNNESVNRKLTSIMRKFHAEGTLWRDIKNIVETPLFVDSKLTSMIQIVDLASYATRRYCEKGEAELFNRIYPRFDRKDGRVVGLRHYTSNTGCSCQICANHSKKRRT